MRTHQRVYNFESVLGSGRPKHFHVRRRGFAKRDYVDPFYFCLTVSWEGFLTVVLSALVVVNAVFAAL